MKILFIGNSYTFFNDLPAMVDSLAADSGIDVSVDSVTKGGRFLYESLGEDEYALRLRQLIGENEYDVLVLQEQSHFAIKDYGKFEESIGALKNLVNAKRTVLYATWGRKTGSSVLDDYGITSRQMTDKLYDAYTRAAAKHGCEINPVGLCFAYIYENSPEIELYNKDKSHPSEIGSSLAAIAFFKRIFGRLPDSFSALSLDEDTLAKLLNAIEKFV